MSTFKHSSLVVNGFVRNYTKIKDIVRTIISYYHIIEQFIKSTHSLTNFITNGIHLYKRNPNLHYDDDMGFSFGEDESTIYGQHTINAKDLIDDYDKYVEWQLQIGKDVNFLHHDFQNIFIGITIQSKAFANFRGKVYGVYATGHKVITGCRPSPILLKDKLYWMSGDIITMRLCEKFIMFYRNDIFYAMINIYIQKTDILKLTISIKGFCDGNLIVSLKHHDILFKR